MTSHDVRIASVRGRRAAVGFMLLVWAVCGPAGHAQQRPQQAGANRRGTPRDVESSPPAAATRMASISRRSITFTPEREAAALTFIEINRPELQEVLQRLKGTNRQEYEQAICDFFWTSETLAALRQHDPRGHDLALRAWRLEAQTHLLVSQLAARPSDSQRLQSELEQAVTELVDAQIETSAHETRRLEAQLRRAQDRHARLAGRREELVRERLAALSAAMAATGNETGADQETEK